VAAFGSGIDLLRSVGILERLADGTDVVVSNGVVSTTAAADDLTDEFAQAFASELAKHRAWERETDPIPA
jgi:catalase